MQDIISRVVTAHVRSINQGEKDTAQVIHTLSTVYDRWRAKVSATLLQAQGSFATSNSRPSGSAAALRARTNLGGDVADIPKGIADPTDAGDSHSMHSRTADVQRNSNLNDRTAGRGSDSTAGIAGTGAMSAADILSDIADSMSEEDADRTGSRSNIAAEALQSAVASHDDTITAGAARTAGRAATSGTAGNRATRDEEVLSSVANTRQSGRNAAAGRSRTAGAHAVTDEDVDNVVQDGRQSSRSDPAADTHTTTSDSRSVAEIIREIASRRDPLDDMPDEEVANPQGDTGSHVLHAEIQNAWAQDADDFGLGEVEEADEEDLLDRAVTANLAGAGRQSAAAAATGRNVEHRSNLESLQAIPDDDNEMVSLSLPQRAKHRPGVATNRNTEAQISQESEQGMADEDEDDENMSLDLLQPARTSSAGTNARSAQANAKSAEGKPLGYN